MLVRFATNLKAEQIPKLPHNDRRGRVLPKKNHESLEYERAPRGPEECSQGAPRKPLQGCAWRRIAPRVGPVSSRIELGRMCQDVASILPRCASILLLVSALTRKWIQSIQDPPNSQNRPPPPGLLKLALGPSLIAPDFSTVNCELPRIN